MNKRILELAEQAGIAVWGDAVYMYHPHVSDTLDSTVLAKFTELIIRECGEWVNDNLGLLDEEARADLLKHFRVEE